MSEKAKVFIGGGLTVGVSINGHILKLPLFIFMFIYLYIYMFIYVFINMFIYMFIYIYICL